MGDISIYNSLRIAKVASGHAWQYQGMRTFDDTAQVCPTRANVDDVGREASRDSIYTYAPGCYSALDRMTTENMQRPRYSTYLNASAINMPGAGDDDLLQPDGRFSNAKNTYDTQLGNQYVRPIANQETINPVYSYDKFSASGETNPQYEEANRVNCFMNAYQQRSCNNY